MNNYLQYLILAIVQGLSEILPISSSAHLILVSGALGLPADNLSLSIFLHLGSALAVIIFFRKRLWRLVKGFFNYIFHRTDKEEFHLAMLLIIASIPAGIGGIFLQSFIENYLMTPFFIGLFLLTTGLLLIVASHQTKTSRTITETRFRNGLSIGFFQLIGIVPGISRSGITYVGTKANKLNSMEASEFIFLMFLPVSIGSGILESIKLASNPVTIDIGPLLMATAVVIILTYLSLILFLAIIKKNKMYYFSYYLLPLGLILMCRGLYSDVLMQVLQSFQAVLKTSL